jgi:hypothetical protein
MRKQTNERKDKLIQRGLSFSMDAGGDGGTIFRFFFDFN